MLQSTVISISGLLIWYAFKFLLVYHPKSSQTTYILKHLKYLLPSIAVLALSLSVWASNKCHYSLKHIAAASVIISAAVVARGIMHMRQKNMYTFLLPGQAACMAVLAHMSGISIVAQPQSTCSAITTLLSVALGLGIVMQTVYLRRRDVVE